jgi:DNA-binding Lrp family transcriptional regulator
MKPEFKSGILDRVDLEILGHLRKNARETLTRISKGLQIPISSAFDRLKRLEGTRIITRYTGLLGLKKIGIHGHAILLFTVKKSLRDDLESYLAEKPFVNNLIRTNGERNLVAECLFPGIKELESFVESISKEFKGLQFSVLYVLEDLKREGFLADKAPSKDKAIPRGDTNGKT